jgi:hypothetical protein
VEIDEMEAGFQAAYVVLATIVGAVGEGLPMCFTDRVQLIAVEALDIFGELAFEESEEFVEILLLEGLYSNGEIYGHTTQREFEG